MIKPFTIVNTGYRSLGQLGDVMDFAIILNGFDDMRGAGEFEAEEWV